MLTIDVQQTFRQPLANFERRLVPKSFINTSCHPQCIDQKLYTMSIKSVNHDIVFISQTSPKGCGLFISFKSKYIAENFRLSGQKINSYTHTI